MSNLGRHIVTIDGKTYDAIPLNEIFKISNPEDTVEKALDKFYENEKLQNKNKNDGNKPNIQRKTSRRKKRANTILKEKMCHFQIDRMIRKEFDQETIGNSTIGELEENPNEKKIVYHVTDYKK